eukprot:PhM_4_TR2448/c2_g4_i1/m.79202
MMKCAHISNINLAIIKIRTIFYNIRGSNIKMYKKYKHQPHSLRHIRILLIKSGIHPNPGPALHEIAHGISWFNAEFPRRLSKVDALNELDRMGLRWRSTPLAWDSEKNKKTGIIQTTNTSKNSTGFYVRCIDADVSVIDLDSDTPVVRELLRVIGGKCNLVAKSPNGLHLYFRHHKDLPRAFVGGPDLGYDIRTHDGRSSDIILLPPSAYMKYGTPQVYEWHVVPSGPLFQIPDQLLNLIPSLHRKVHRAPRQKPTKKHRAQPQTSHRPSPPIRIVSWNMHQGSKTALAEIPSLMVEYDVIALQEIGSTNSTLQLYNDFTFFTTEASYGRSVALLVRNSIVDAAQQHHFATSEGITTVAVELVIAGKCLSIYNVYVSPGSTVADFNLFLKDALAARPDIIMGDLNARDSKWCPASAQDDKEGNPKNSDARKRGSVVCNFLKGSGWSLAALAGPTPTHFSSTTRPTTPDVILLAPNLHYDSFKIMPTPASDHAQVALQLPEVVPTRRRPSGPAKVAWRRVKKHHELHFQDRLDSLLKRYDSSETLDSRVYALVAAIRTAAKCLPRGKRNYIIPAWSTKLTNLRKQAIELSLSTTADAVNARERYNSALLEEYDEWVATRPSNFWGKPKQSKVLPTLVLPDGARASTPQTKCASLAAHFASKHVNNAPTTPFEHRSMQPPEVISRTELIAAIRTHPKRKSADPDGLKAEHLLLLSMRALDILREIFTDSLSAGVVPRAWRTARTCPLAKPGKPTSELNSYRPVSVTSIVCRTLERIILKRLEKQLQTFTHKCQYGFRRAFSSEQLLRAMYTELKPSADKKEVSLITAFDMSDAFCRVHRDIVANRLVETMEVNPTYAKWIHAFMSGRTFRVYEGDYSGLPVILEHGVPQGSVLGPLLWNVFVNPLFNSLDETATKYDTLNIFKARIRTFGYADDLTTTISLKRTPFCSPNRVVEVGEAVLATVAAWCRTHGVALSAKSRSLFVGPGMNWAPQTLLLRNAAAEVPCQSHSQSLRVLGLLWDSGLSFEEHAKHLLRLLENDRQDLLAQGLCYSIHHLKTAVKARSLARIKYAMDTYYPTLSRKTKDQLQSMLAKCCRAVLGTFTATSCQANLYECGISSLDDIARRQDTRRRLEATALPSAHPFHNVLSPPHSLSDELRPTPLFLPYNPANLDADKVHFFLDHRVSADAPAADRRQSCERLMSSAPTPTLEVWTDGSLQVCEKPCTGAAAMFWRGQAHVATVSAANTGSSSFYAEYTALQMCLDELTRRTTPHDTVSIVTDSLANVKMLSLGPLLQTTSQGVEMWQQILAVQMRVKSLSFIFVFGHCDLYRGDAVDIEAKRAVHKPQTLSTHNLKEVVWRISPDTPQLNAGYRSRYRDGPETDTPELNRRDLQLLYALRTGACEQLGAHKVMDQPETCPICYAPVLQRHGQQHPVDHLFECPTAMHPEKPLTPKDLWKRPKECVEFFKKNISSKFAILCSIGNFGTIKNSIFKRSF